MATPALARAGVAELSGDYRLRTDGTPTRTVIRFLAGSAPNAPPTAANDTADPAFETALVIAVLANDDDPDGTLNPASVIITTDPTRGTAEVDPVTGEITYTPNPGESGDDSFAYTVADDEGAVSNEATVAVTIGAAPNLPPVSEGEQVTTAFETAVIIDVLTNDTDPDGTLDPTTVTITTDPTRGTVQINADGTITYTPNPGESGDDSFTYTVADDQGAVSNEATVTVTIGTAPNQPPVAANDQVNTAFETAVIIALLANDGDPDGVLDPGSVTITADPTLGTVQVNPDGTVTYTPNAGESGDDNFTYTVADNDGAVSNDATVAVAIAAPPQAPVDAIVGTARSERLFGTPEEDEIFALGGNDVVFALASDDVVHGGTGNDRMQGGLGDDELYGDTGNDVIDGNAGDDLAFGGRGNDRVEGGLGDDILVGGLGNDQLAGGLGFDVAIFDGAFADFRITGRSAAARGVRDLNGEEGNDALTLVEILQFDDGFFDIRDDSFTEGFANDRVEALMTRPGFSTDPAPASAPGLSVAQVEMLVTEAETQG